MIKMIKIKISFYQVIIHRNKIIFIACSLRRMFEQGIIKHLIDKRLASSFKCPNPTSFKPTAQNLRALSLKDFYGVFFIWFGG